MLLVADLLLFSKRFPPCFDLWSLVLPLLADDFGNLRVRETGILSDDLGLLVLAIQDEGVPGSRDLGLWLADADVYFAAVASRMRRVRVGESEVFVLGLHNASGPLSCCPTERGALFRRQWSLGWISARGT